MGFFTFSLSMWSLEIIKDADSVYGFILQKMFIKTQNDKIESNHSGQ